MSQQAIRHHNAKEINAPFRAKSAGVSMITVMIIGVYYATNALSMLPTDESIPDGALGLVISTIVLIVVVEATLQIVLFIGAGRIEERVERDEVITARASRNAYLVLTAGAFITFASMFANFTPFEMGSSMILAFLLAEVVKFASQTVYYWRTT